MFLYHGYKLVLLTKRQGSYNAKSASIVNLEQVYLTVSLHTYKIQSNVFSIVCLSSSVLFPNKIPCCTVNFIKDGRNYEKRK